MAATQTIRIDRNFDAGSELFGRQMRIFRATKGGILVRYSSGPCTAVNAQELSEFIPAFKEVNPSKIVPVNHIHTLYYYIGAYKEPFEERIAKFENGIMNPGWLEEGYSLSSGDVGAELRHQIGLRLERIYGLALPAGRTLELMLVEQKRTVVTPDVISLMKSHELGSRVAFLSEKYAPAN